MMGDMYLIHPTQTDVPFQRSYSPLYSLYFYTLYFPLYNSTCMRSVVNFQVFKSRKTFSTKCTSVRFLISVCSDVYQHLVSEI